MQITNIIQKTPGVSGGHACVRNTRIPVWTLVSLRHESSIRPELRSGTAPAVGATEQELLSNYPGLTLEDLTAVWGYYYNYKSEIDSTIVELED